MGWVVKELTTESVKRVENAKKACEEQLTQKLFYFVPAPNCKLCGGL